MFSNFWKTNKNIIFFVCLFVILILTLFFYEFSLFLKILTTESIGGLSSGKAVFFIISLITFLFLSNLTLKPKKHLKILGILIAGIILLNFWSYFVFIDYNYLPLRQIEFVYSSETDTFSYNDIEHVHSFKPAMFPFVREKIFNEFDFGLEYYHYMPEWFHNIYYLGFFLYLIFVIFFVKNFLAIEKKERFSNFFLAGSAFFLLSNSFFDGGLITPTFFAGIVTSTLLFRSLIFKKKKEKATKKSSKKINYLNIFKTYLTIPIIIGIAFITNTFFFFISQTTTILCLNKIIFNKKIIQKFYWIIILGIIILLALEFGMHSFTAYNFYNKELPAGQKILAYNDFVKESDFIEKIGENGGLILYQIKKEDFVKNVLDSGANEKAGQYFFLWGNHCNFIYGPYRVMIYTKDTFNEKIDTSFGTIMKNITLKSYSPTMHLLKFEGSTCVKDYKRIVVDYLKKQGLRDFVSTQ